MGLFSELKLAVPWGHIAAKVWGSQQGLPVLCLHGWLDNANSFDRLIPLLPKDFQYVAMDFGGHGLSSHYSPGFPYYQQNFVSEIRRVTAALKWNRFSLMGHSFGWGEQEAGDVSGEGRASSHHQCHWLVPVCGCTAVAASAREFSCLFPEMVDKLILLDSSPLTLDTKEISNLLTYKRKAIEHMLQVEASKKPRQVVGPEEMLQGLLKNNHHVGEECGKLLLQRGATQEAAGLVLNRDRRITWPQHCLEFISRELFVHAIRKLQARVLLIKATQGYYDVRRENDADRDFILFLNGMLTSVLKEGEDSRPARAPGLRLHAVPTVTPPCPALSQA
ncbi:serine hydrolase-like protein 2 isoform X2 [Manis pentadactyla]|uniref:serine hydrolase-like protein 2 isoform X2 n=1 Tax=Manis pentadactyla TaxID=143292 RepID=UPI00255C4CE4|nr:serine hydrolase-like protein 2 isoform X2 [Manis pentadactyla]